MSATEAEIFHSPDTRLHQLGTAENFVICSLRLWLLPHCSPSVQWPQWRDGFEQAGLSAQGAQGFDALCHILASGALEPLEVHALRCSKLGTHEMRLLLVLGLLQRDQTTAATAFLARQCTPAATRLALEPAQALAAALRERGLWLSAPCLLEVPGSARVH